MTKLLISEIYDKLTWQGEGKSMGQLCSFIRLGGCNLGCHWCFGVKPSRRVPRIIMSNAPNKKIFEVELGDVLLTFDEGRNFVETTVREVMSRDVYEWYELVIEGVEYYVTPEHPFFTSRGMIETRNLVVGDNILHATPKDKMSQRMTLKNPMKDPSVSRKVHSKIDYTRVASKISSTVKQKKQNGTYHSVWELMDEETKIRTKRALSESKLGPNNPNWKGGSLTPNFDRLKLLCSSGELTICERCSQKRKLEVNHKNGCKFEEYHLYDQEDNLEVICHSCHSRIHRRGNNFWLGERKDGKQLHKELELQNGKVVQKIKRVNILEHPYFGRSYGPKPLRVYNLSCTPYNSYLVDYMWVHNCDSAYTWRFSENQPHHFAPVFERDKELSWMTIDEITSHFVEMNPPMIVITGGEPMLQSQHLPELIESLINEVPALVRIEIETAGTIFSEKVANYPFVYFNVSPKLENSGNPKDLRYKPGVLLSFNDCAHSIFKFVVCDDNDLLEVQQIVDDIGIPNEKIYIMPEGITERTQKLRLESLAQAVLEKRWNMSARLHILIFGDKRGT